MCRHKPRPLLGIYIFHSWSAQRTIWIFWLNEGVLITPATV